jgi:hypothetical protein
MKQLRKMSKIVPLANGLETRMKISEGVLNHNSWQGSRKRWVTLLALLLCSLVISASAQVVVSAPAAMAQISAGTTQVWSLDTKGNTYQYSAAKNKLHKVPGVLQQISVGVGKSVWGLIDGYTYTYNFSASAWDRITTPEAFTSIAAGGQGIWAVNNATGHIFVYDSSNGTFTPPPHGQPSESFNYVFVGSYEIGVWALDNHGDAWLYNTTTEVFDKTDGVLAQITVGTGQVWGITSIDTVWNYDVTTGSWVQPEDSARLGIISAGNNSNIWGIADPGSPGSLWNWNGSSWVEQPEDEALNALSVSSGGAGVFAIGVSGTVYKYNEM